MGYKKEKFNIEVGTSIISQFQRIDIEKFRIFSEFIDNSYQSFIDHKKVLTEDLKVKSCNVDILWTDDEVKITDNAFGMDKEGFARALRLNAPAKSYSEGSLSKYGMGLKYAASNMGDAYTIETTAYGSKYKYKATVDVNDWIINNPKEMEADVNDDFDENKHFTYITIRSLYNKFNETQMKRTIDKLAVMYARFIEKKLLNITINNIPVKYEDPELDTDENGSAIEEMIKGSFIHEGKTYKYWGWIGVLKTGDTANAGLTIIQNDRGITFNYKPVKVYGRPNLYPSQRVVGQIELGKENWNVRVNKDGIVWNANELQDAFLDNLSKNEKVKKIIKYASQKRVSDKRTVNVEAKNCNIDGTNKSYKVGDRITFTVKPLDNYEIDEVKINMIPINANNSERTQYSYDIPVDCPPKISIKAYCKPKKDTSQPKPSANSGDVVVTIPSAPPFIPPKVEPARDTIITNAFKDLENFTVKGYPSNIVPKHRDNDIVIKYANTSYGFEICEVEEKHSDNFIDLKVAPYPYVNSYTIDINFKCGYLDGVFLTPECKDAFIILAISLSLARITGSYSGVAIENSKILMDYMNKFFSKTKK